MLASVDSSILQHVSGGSRITESDSKLEKEGRTERQDGDAIKTL